ncbi:MAG: hypothetical protein RLY43_1066 [Bacteroidota bacterium]
MKVAAVIVTYNRLDLLKECVLAIESQNFKLWNIFVINNGSTDGTYEWLKSKKSIIVLNQENLGGAYGFYAGIKFAYDNGADWIWCLDDDTIANEDTLSKLMSSKFINDPQTGFLSSIVKWTDNSLHKMNAVMPISNLNIYDNILSDQILEISGASFVSLLISRNAVTNCGLPIKEFFIWGDDVEYTNRITKFYKGYLKLDSLVVHKTRFNETADFSLMTKDNYFKYKYLIRNHIWFLRFRRKKKNIILNLVQHLEAIYIIMKNSIRAELTINCIRAIFSGYFFNPTVINKY